MIALDTQILIYAHKEQSPFHAEAKEVMAGLIEHSAPWALPWPVLHEFLSIATNTRIYRPSSTVVEAFGFLDSLLQSPGLQMLSEGPSHLAELKEIVLAGKISGPAFHDAKIAALCLAHGVKELWSADRDFSRMKGLKVWNPLTG